MLPSCARIGVVENRCRRQHCAAQRQALVLVERHRQRQANAWFAKQRIVAKVYQQRLRLVATQNHDGLLARICSAPDGSLCNWRTLIAFIPTHPTVGANRSTVRGHMLQWASSLGRAAGLDERCTAPSYGLGESLTLILNAVS